MSEGDRLGRIQHGQINGWRELTPGDLRRLRRDATVLSKAPREWLRVRCPAQHPVAVVAPASHDGWLLVTGRGVVHWLEQPDGPPVRVSCRCDVGWTLDREKLRVASRRGDAFVDVGAVAAS